MKDRATKYTFCVLPCKKKKKKYDFTEKLLLSLADVNSEILFQIL